MGGSPIDWEQPSQWSQEGRGLIPPSLACECPAEPGLSINLQRARRCASRRKPCASTPSAHKEGLAQQHHLHTPLPSAAALTSCVRQRACASPRHVGATRRLCGAWRTRPQVAPLTCDSACTPHGHLRSQPTCPALLACRTSFACMSGCRHPTPSPSRPSVAVACMGCREWTSRTQPRCMASPLTSRSTARQRTAQEAIGPG